MTRPSEAPQQLALELPYATGWGLADFLRAPCNAAALDAVLRWPRWPTPVLVLCGPKACGKSHLARIWADRAGAVTLAGPELGDPAATLRRLADAAACLVDDADRAPDETVLLHVHNAVVGRRGSLLLTGAEPPAVWPLRLADLRSRLLAASLVRIEPPDDALLRALLVKQFADRQLRVEPTVIEYLVPRLERSFLGMRAAVDQLDRAALQTRRPITLPLAREVLLAAGAESPP